ncbi:MAG TPA: N-acetylmuramoyl-L-alanine amidase [Kofleriaceae bacterium]|nr:N-acetylmuramoyl-L-alanine amidase [Kofleriaceae bacterium]
MAASCLWSGCTTDEPIVDEDGHEQTPGLDDDFAHAARTYGVPVDLLKAIAYVETRWEMVDGSEEVEGRSAGAGVFALYGDNLAIGAAEANVDPELARTDLSANLAAAAARLAALAADRGVTATDLVAWRDVIADFAQNPDDEARAAYVDEVITVLALGATSIAEDGTVVAVIEPHGEIAVPPGPGIPRAGTDFAGAIWRPSPNYNSRGGSGVSLVVIHSCEGNYAACWGWLRNSAAQASAHYVVKEDGGEVTQLVSEANRAWHVAATYDCARAGGSQCNKNGISTNTFSVGIEHAGFASQSSWSAGIIEKSAKLTCDITRDHAIPRDRNHIVSHGQLQPWNRTDPGPNWPWSHYIDRVRANCGDGGGGTGAIIVDSNNANNNQAVAKIELTGTWGSSSATPGYYGTGYWYANTAQTSAPATFWFYLPAAGTKTVDAWWTAGSNRSSGAPFIAFNAAGNEVGRRTVNQQGSGSQWVTLGTWSFSAGWNKVVLSRWAAEGSVVIADAVRIR